MPWRLSLCHESSDDFEQCQDFLTMIERKEDLPLLVLRYAMRSCKPLAWSTIIQLVAFAIRNWVNGIFQFQTVYSRIVPIERLLQLRFIFCDALCYGWICSCNLWGNNPNRVCRPHSINPVTIVWHILMWYYQYNEKQIPQNIYYSPLYYFACLCFCFSFIKENRAFWSARFLGYILLW